MKKVKSRKQIEALIEQIEADERLHYPRANVFINAPLALIQVELESQVRILKFILNDAPLSNAPTSAHVE